MAPGVEITDINWIALAIVVVVNIVLGFLWYNPKTPTGRIWVRENTIQLDRKPTGRELAKGLTLMVLGAFFMLFVFQHTFVAYRDAYDLDTEGEGYKLTMVDGAIGALMMWLAFIVPVLWSSVAWENKSWSLFFVNATYYLVTLLTAGLVYAGMLSA